MSFSLKSSTPVGSGLISYRGLGKFEDPRITATVTNGTLSLAVATDLPGDYYTSAPAVTITDRGTGTTAAPTATVAAATANIGGGAVTSVTVTRGGHFYTAAPAMSASGGFSAGGNAGTYTANLGTGVSAGMVTSVTIANAGANVTAAPSLSFAAATASVDPSATALLGNGYVIGVSFTGTAPHGYTAAPSLSFSGGGGSGAVAVCDLDTSSGSVTTIRVTNPGSGYTSAPSITVGSAGEVTAITATALIAAKVTGFGSVAGFGFTSTPMVQIASPQAVVIPVNNFDIQAVEGPHPVGRVLSTADVLQWTLPTLSQDGSLKNGQYAKSITVPNAGNGKGIVVITRTATTLQKDYAFSVGWLGR